MRTGWGRLLAVDHVDVSGFAGALKQLLLASYGLYPADLAREVADAAGRLGGEDVIVLLSDYDQRALVGFESDDDRTFAIDGPGPGLAFGTRSWSKSHCARAGDGCGYRRRTLRNGTAFLASLTTGRFQRATGRRLPRWSAS